MDREKAIKSLKKQAKKNHPHSNGILRWKGGFVAKSRVCNLCETGLGSFDGRYPRTKQSYREEEEHIEEHIRAMEDESYNNCGSNEHWVRGYTRTDGKFIAGHCARNSEKSRR